MGPSAEVFLFKSDAEGFDGAVVAGARGLFEGKRVKYLIFENNHLWLTVPAMPGYERQTVGQVVTELSKLHYPCWYITPWGLIPFPAHGTPEGDRQYETPCKQGASLCSRHSLYDRAFWSTLLCALEGETDEWFDWLQDATLRPRSTTSSLQQLMS